MACFAYDKTGSVRDNPSEKEMMELLQSISGSAEGQPDVSLNDDDGWSISYNSAHTVVFSNLETGKGPWSMKGMAAEQALELWKLLAAAKLEDLHSKPWQQGKG